MGNRKNRAKQSFLLYHDSRDLFAKLSPEDCQTLILGLFDYSMEQDVFFPPGSAVDIAFTVIRTYMDKNALKYEERCRINRQNGAKGGAPRGNKNAEKKPQPTASMASNLPTGASSPGLLTRACPGPERARNRLKRLRVFLHSKVCREEWHDVATPPLFRLAEYGKFFLV